MNIEEDIMLMAREAGPLTKGPFDAWCKRFAALVAAHEREACAKVCDEFQARDVGMQPAECAGAIRARGNT